MVKCYIWKVLLYGVENSTLNVASISKLEAFEMLLRISGVDRIRSDQFLRKAGVEGRLYQQIKDPKVNYLGHILREERYRTTQIILQEKMEERLQVVRKQRL